MRQFNSNTFVCFIDISGFKVELRKNKNLAGYMLDVFYSAGYNTLKEYKSLNGIFVSDCGIIYSDKGNDSTKLNELLGAIKEINQKMLNENFLTTTSIAYGYLEYKRKFVFDRIKKNAIIGSGYLNAFLDNDNVNHKLRAGEVRITKNLDDVRNAENLFQEINFNNTFSRFLTDKESHYYFNWLCKNEKEKNNTDEIYLKFDNDDPLEKYNNLKKALQNL